MGRCKMQLCRLGSANWNDLKSHATLAFISICIGAGDVVERLIKSRIHKINRTNCMWWGLPWPGLGQLENKTRCTHTHAHKDEQGNCSLLNHFERLILDQGQLVYSILRSAGLLLLPRHCCHLQKLLLGAPKPNNTPTLCPASPCGASSCGQLAKLPHNSRA